MKEERITLPSGGLLLEGICHTPEGHGPFPGVTVCHPHPLYGGSMDSSVVYAVCRELSQQGAVALRFNFRGVGRSQGKLEGVGMTEDVSAALAFLASMDEVDAERLGVCGYSAGAIAAFSNSSLDRLAKAIAAISPPLGMANLDGLEQWRGPKFLIMGSMDNFTSQVDFECFTDQLPDPKECHVVPGVDHFWWGYEGQLAADVASFFARSLKGNRGG